MNMPPLPIPRIFVAVPIAAVLKESISQHMELLRETLAFRRWVHPEDVHITLQFLGPVPSGKVEDIVRALEAVAHETRPFDLSVSGIGSFGVKASPRILWAGVAGELDQLSALQAKVTRAMQPLGFQPEDRPYRPHITLAKNFRGNTDPADALRQAKEALDNADLRWKAGEMVLYESHLGQSPMYRALKIFPLG